MTSPQRAVVAWATVVGRVPTVFHCRADIHRVLGSHADAWPVQLMWAELRDRFNSVPIAEVALPKIWTHQDSPDVMLVAISVDGHPYAVARCGPW